MRIAEAVRKRLEDLYSRSGATIWVYSKDGQQEEFHALPSGDKPELFHKLQKGHRLVGPLNLATGEYGSPTPETIATPDINRAYWKLVLLTFLQVTLKAAQIALVIVGTGFALFMGIVTGIGGSDRRRL